MNPTFGDKVEEAHYQTRYGVYAVIPNQDKTKIILERELIEEIGYTATLGQYYGQADEYFYSSHRDTYYYNPAYIYEVVDFSEIGKPLEDFNNLAWFPIDEAIAKLKRGSHKWGIEQWKESNTLIAKS